MGGFDSGALFKPVTRSIFIVLACLWAYGVSCSAQPLQALRGLIYVPTAEMETDGAFLFGAGLSPNVCLFDCLEPRYGVSARAALQFFPFLQVGLQLVHAPGNRSAAVLDEQDTDRAFSFRVRLWQEKDLLPALAIGGDDVVGISNHYPATYAVASKSIVLASALPPLGVHVGYGVQMLGWAQAEHRLTGLFGGIAVEPHQRVRLMIEHDGDRFSGGVELRLGALRVLVAAHGFARPAGSIGYGIQL